MTDLVPAGSTRPLRRAQIAVATTFVLHGLLFASWTAHIPHVKADLRVGDARLGLALLGAPVGSVIAMMIAGLLIPRIGSRRLVQVSLVGYCLSGPLAGLVGSVGGLFGALLVWGLFQGMLDVSMNTQAITVEGQRRRPLMNGLHAGWSIGAFVGAGAGTLAVALGVTLSCQLLVLGSVALLVAGRLSFWMLADAPTERTPTRAEGGARRISSAMLLLGAIAFASMLCEGAAADWSSVYLRDDLGSGVPGLGYTAFALAMVTVRLFGNRLLDRYRADVLLPAFAAVTTVTFAVALAVGSVPFAVAGFFILGLGVGTVIPTMFSAAGQLPGMHPGVGVAAVSGIGWAGFVCGPPIIGALAGATSLPLALGVVPLLTAFIAIAARRIPVADRGDIPVQPGGVGPRLDPGDTAANRSTQDI
jgi:MFS family permease